MNVKDFIAFALSHAKAESIPTLADLHVPIEECGTDPWEYLFGTTGHVITQELLDSKFASYYSKHGWTRDRFDAATDGWVLGKVRVCDCQGLLDCYLKTDINAERCYTSWCTHKGEISELSRPFEIGEALFVQNKQGKMYHVGWVCGFDADGEPLAVEARGVLHGVVVTRLEDRPWTHRGLMTKKFNYKGEPMILERTEPMMQGEAVTALQQLLNLTGYPDQHGEALEEDGKLGDKTYYALIAFAKAHYVQTVNPTKPLEIHYNDMTIYVTTGGDVK